MKPSLPATLGSATLLVKELAADGLRNKRGRAFDKGMLYKLLHNRVYLGEAVLRPLIEAK